MFISNVAKVYYASYSKNTFFIEIFFNSLAKFQDKTPPQTKLLPLAIQPHHHHKIKTF